VPSLAGGAVADGGSTPTGGGTSRGKHAGGRRHVAGEAHRREEATCGGSTPAGEARQDLGIELGTRSGSAPRSSVPDRDPRVWAAARDRQRPAAVGWRPAAVGWRPAAVGRLLAAVGRRLAAVSSGEERERRERGEERNEWEREGRVGVLGGRAHAIAG
jgi:hypothetical protein